MKIEFLKVERDCSHNKAVHAVVERGGLLNRSNLIYDFNVAVDGVVRAIFHRSPDKFNKSYFLRTIYGDGIRWMSEGKPELILTRGQKAFHAIIEHVIGEDLLPTPEKAKQMHEERMSPVRKSLNNRSSVKKTFDAFSKAVHSGKMEMTDDMKQVAIMSGPSEVIEAMVQCAMKDSGLKMDWCFQGGRAFIVSTGTFKAARHALYMANPQSDLSQADL